MADKFLKIAITSPETIDREAMRIVAILESGFDYVHIRKPSWNEQQMRRLLEDIPATWRQRIVLHDFHHLAGDNGAGGVHLNSRNPVPPAGDVGFSVSCHTLSEIKLHPGARYRFLSPVYPSISKPGYMPHFTLNEISSLITGKNVVALGGITPDKFNELRQAGFIGAAMLGYLWN